MRQKWGGQWTHQKSSLSNEPDEKVQPLTSLPRPRQVPAAPRPEQGLGTGHPTHGPLLRSERESETPGVEGLLEKQYSD